MALCLSMTERSSELSMDHDVTVSLTVRSESQFKPQQVPYYKNVLNEGIRYSKLKVGTRGKDFFAETQTNMKRDIYPEDLPMMAHAMQKENLLKNLFSYGKTCNQGIL